VARAEGVEVVVAQARGEVIPSSIGRTLVLREDREERLVLVDVAEAGVARVVRLGGHARR
jgi:hypothetical protein